MLIAVVAVEMVGCVYQVLIGIAWCVSFTLALLDPWYYDSQQSHEANHDIVNAFVSPREQAAHGGSAGCARACLAGVVALEFDWKIVASCY